MTIDVFSCVANGQPGDLLSCLNGYVENAVAYGRSPLVLVIDQTLDPVRRNASRAVAAQVHRANRVDVDCISQREMEAFITRAGRYSWVDVETLRYAILGDHQVAAGYGAACNVAQLAAGASAQFIADSVTRYEPIGTPGGDGSTAIHLDDAPPKYDAFASDVEAMRFFGSVQDMDRMPKVYEEDLLGMAGDALETSAAVSFGTWMDVGLESPGFYLLSDKALIALDDAAYVRDRFNRIVLRVSNNKVVGDANLRLHAFALRSSSMPFLPSESVQGGLTGQSLTGVMLRCVQPSMAITAMPFAVKRSSATQVFAQEDPATVVRRIGFTDFLSIAVGSVRSAKTVADLGAGTTRLVGSQSFVSSVMGTWARSVSELAKARSGKVESGMMEEDLLSIVAADDEWRGKSINDLVPYELRSGVNPEQAAAVFFGQISKFSRLLSAWPGLVAAVSDLGKNGIRLGTNQ